MTGENLILIISMFSGSILNIFVAVGSVSFLDTGLSILQVYISIMLLELLIWFIIKFVIGREVDNMEGYESEQARYEQYGETKRSSATVDEIDFSEEIVNE